MSENEENILTKNISEVDILYVKKLLEEKNKLLKMKGKNEDVDERIMSLNYELDAYNNIIKFLENKKIIKFLNKSKVKE